MSTTEIRSAIASILSRDRRIHRIMTNETTGVIENLLRMHQTPWYGIPLFSSRHQAGERKTSILMGKLAKLQTGESKESIHILEDGSTNAMTIQSLQLPNPLLSSWPPPLAISNLGTMLNGITSTVYLCLWAILPMEMRLGLGRNEKTKSIAGK